MIYIFLFILFILFVNVEKIIKYFSAQKRGWKFCKKSYNKIIYSEKISTRWQHIEIDARINIGTFEPIFKNEEDWKNYPNWAQNRDLIINCIIKKYPLKH
jgi:hypothetical protein